MRPTDSANRTGPFRLFTEIIVESATISVQAHDLRVSGKTCNNSILIIPGSKISVKIEENINARFLCRRQETSVPLNAFLIRHVAFLHLGQK